MSKKTKKIILESALVLSLALPILAAGQTPTTPITSITDVQSVLNRILQIIYVIFFIIAAIFIIIAAFTYLTAQGDPEKVTKAKQQLIYAIVAIVVALIAVGIDNIVSGILSGGTLTTTP